MENILRIGDFQLEAASGTLEGRISDEPARLSPKATEVLLCLASQHGRVVTRDELHEQVWPGQYVTDSQVSKAINELRAALGDQQKPHQYIETLPRRGYRLVAEIREITDAPPQSVAFRSPAGSTSTDQPSRSSRSRYLRAGIAFGCVAMITGVAALWLLDVGGQGESTLNQSNEALLGDIAIGIERPADLTGSADFAAWPRTIAEDLVDAIMEGTPLVVVPEYGESSPLGSEDLDYRLRSSLRVDEAPVLHLELINNRSGQAMWVDEVALDPGEDVAPGFPRASYVAHVLNLTINVDLRRKDWRFNNEEARALFVRAFVGEQLGFSEGRERAMSLRDAVRLVEEAAQLDPDSPGPLAYLAYLYTSAYWLEDDYAKSAKANDAGNRALSMNFENPWAHYAMGIVKRGLDRDFDAAENHFQLAQQFGWESGDTEFQLGFVDEQRGNLESAVSHYEQSFALGGDSMSPHTLVHLCDVLLMLGRYNEAEEYLDRWENSVQAEQAKIYAPWARIAINAKRGDLDTAGALLDRNLEANPNPPKSLLASSLALVGRQDEARQLLDELQQPYTAGERFNCFFAFLAAYRLGELDLAFTWMDRMLDLRQSHPMLHGVEFDAIREDPRFQQAMKRIDAYTITSTSAARTTSDRSSLLQ